MFMKSIKINFGNQLRNIRRTKGLTQEDLAKLLKTSQRMIAHYEKEDNSPRIEKVKEFANALKVPIEELIGEKPKEKKEKKEEDVSFKIMKKVRVIEKLPVRDQKAIFRLINSLAEKNKIK
jgi:transcriptional regulator with XRE-family HTH domain